MKKLFILTTIGDDSTNVEHFTSLEKARGKVGDVILKKGLKLAPANSDTEGADIVEYPGNIWITSQESGKVLEFQIHEISFDPATLQDA